MVCTLPGLSQHLGTTPPSGLHGMGSIVAAVAIVVGSVGSLKLARGSIHGGQTTSC